MTRRNTKERALYLAKRAVRQLSRLGGLQMVGVPANINRRTGEPHMEVHFSAYKEF